MSLPLSQFFDRLASFDTETTGLNASRDNIWQLGFTNYSTNVESEVNPFLYLDAKTNKWKSSKKTRNKKDYSTLLRNSNGEFSEATYQQGAFNNNIAAFGNRSIGNIDSGFVDTLGRLDTNDIIVMQNMKFESKFLLDKRMKGLISEDHYQKVLDQMQFLDSKDPLKLFNIPPKVQEALREAEFKRYSSIEGRTSVSFNTKKDYAARMNNVIDAYSEAFQKSNGKAIVVEQMDITKALYANAIAAGIMPESNATVGLSVDFLTNALYGRSEKHTALSDSIDTKELFKDTWQMIEELRGGTISDSTRDNLNKIVSNQSNEVLNQFNKTITSVLDDFQTRGETSTGFHRKASYIYDTVTNESTHVQGIDVGGSNKYTSSLEDALNTVNRRYGGSPEQLEGRQSYIEDLKNMHESGSSFQDIYKYHQGETKDPQQFARTLQSAESEGSSLFPKNSNFKKYAIGAGVATLGYMWLKGDSKPKDENKYVAEEFYDEMHMGTVFFDFDNRNKHYMY